MTEVPFAYTQRTAAIAELSRQHEEAFSSWKPSRKRPVFPNSVLPYLVPKALLGFARDPKQVAIVKDRDRRLKGGVRFFVVERMASPVTNRASLDAYHAERQKHLLARQKIVFDWKAELTDESVSPPDVDPMHYRYYDDLRRKLFTVNDKVLLHVYIKWMGDNQIHVEDYQDREEWRKSGVGREFYTRLYGLAKKAGCNFVTGSNSADNIDIYLEKFGRRRFSDLSSSDQRQIRENLRYEPGNYFTVACL